MIYSVVETSELKPVLLCKDTIEEEIEYSRSEWIQWIVANSKNPLFKIIVDSESKNSAARAYLVALYAKSPPISEYIQIIYLFGRENYDFTEILNELKIWTKSLGVSDILLFTNVLNFGYDFKLKNHLMKLEV